MSDNYKTKNCGTHRLKIIYRDDICKNVYGTIEIGCSYDEHADLRICEYPVKPPYDSDCICSLNQCICTKIDKSVNGALRAIHEILYPWSLSFW